MSEDLQQLLRELHTGLALVRADQTGINSRIGSIEDALNDDEEDAETARSEWMRWLGQTVGQVVLVSFITWLLQQMGVSPSEVI